MYCSKECLVQDWKIHQKVCKEDLEERKKKGGREDRETEAKDRLEELGKYLVKLSISEEEARCGSDIVNNYNPVVDGENSEYSGCVTHEYGEGNTVNVMEASEGNNTEEKEAASACESDSWELLAMSP